LWAARNLSRSREYAAFFYPATINEIRLYLNLGNWSAIEQLIHAVNKGKFENIRNPIDPNSEFYEGAIQWATEYVQKSGIEINY